MKKLFLVAIAISAATFALAQTNVDALMKAGKLNEAVAELSTQIAGQPNNDVLLVKRGECFFAMDRYSDALDDLDKAIEKNSKNGKAYARRAQLMQTLERPEDCLQDINKAIEYEPKPEYHFFRGSLYAAAQLNTQAILDFADAINKGYAQPEVYYNKAIAEFADNRVYEARQDCDKAISMDSKWAEPLIMRSQLKLTDLDLDGACTDAKQGLTILKQPYNDTLLFYCNHRDYPTYFTLGIEFEQKQLFEAAAKAYSKCIDLRPDSVQMYVSRGAMYQNLRMYDKAEADYLKAESKGIKNELLYYNWALMKLVQEDYKKAYDHFDKVVKNVPKESQTASLYFQRGYCAAKLANYDQAMADYTAAIRMDSAQYAAFGHRAYIKFIKKQYAEAKADAQKSLDIYPDYAYGHLMRGKVRHELKEPEACEELELAHNGGSPEAQALLKELCGKEVAPLPKN